ncbi:ATP-binding protein [Anaerocolumna sp. AGMB13025]|uniref:HD domain-containing protein n=1 Tax=Anaerocolumna sp. AGMB13025 TaxID=3039116 RepID=UPI00241D0878|nr:ATP-binding protein [Anaerocolumna sp. AGMB13025]WFR58804.1 ATP-binding protein [Anaerocolumna sp. AGMB13025]
MNENALLIRLEKLSLYKELSDRCKKDLSLHPILTLIQNVGEYAIAISKSIIMNMREYTLHDDDHIFGMLYLAGKLIPKDTLEKLSTADIMMIILSIFLHDIGMSPEGELIRAWKNQLLENEMVPYKNDIAAFQRFRSGFVRELQEIESFQKNEQYAKAQLLEDQIITNYIRNTHADRARKLIAKDWAGKIKYKDADLTSTLAEICFSHNENHLALLDMETIKLCGEDTFLCVPFIAVILRLTDIMDFDSKRTPNILFSHLTIKNAVSLSEWVKHLSVSGWTFQRDTVTFSAQCSHPAIEASIKDFCNQIDDELKNSTFVLANLASEICDIEVYKIKLPAYVNRKKIGAKRDIETNLPIYSYRDTKFTLNKRQVVDLLMGTKLYGKPEVALRELLQNSIDACQLRRSLSERWKDNYIPRISVSMKTIDGVDYLIVEDNGIGMNQHIVDSYYTNIGQSYYTSTEFYDLMSETSKTFKPISRFGIGILACFMVCDNMEVETRKILGSYQTDEALSISIEGYDSLFIIKNGMRNEPGTQTTLRLRDVHPWQRMDKKEFISCIKKLVPLPPFDIEIYYDDYREVCTPATFEELDFTLEDEYSWSEEDNIKIISFDLNDQDKGFRGKAEIAYIVNHHDQILKKLDICKKEVIVEGESFTLSSSISYATNCIHKSSTSIEVNEDGDVNAHDSFRERCKSSSCLSIHGIDVPCSLFRNFTNWGQKAVLELPIPIRFRLDIGSVNDLNLNSARTQVIYDEVWIAFERQFIETILSKIKVTVPKSTWNTMKSIFGNSSKNEVFLELLNSL